MNERIKELAEQATEYDYTTWDSHNQKEVVHYKFNQQKFAELIVQECAQLAMTQHCSTSPAEYGDMEPYEQGCDDTASAISGLIRRTFGVE